MRLRYTLNALIGAAATVALGASVASAQATSQRRIPISKEAPGEVTHVVDTVTMYKTDTLRLTSPTVYDTVRMTNTVTRVDTVIPPPPALRLPGGLYFGVGAGMNLPEGSLYVPNAPGNAFQAQLGWQGARSLLGVRFDGIYSKPGEDSQFSGFQADPDIININGDLKLQLPWFHHLLGRSPAFSLYGIGGGSYIMYKNLPMVLNTAVPGQPFPGVRTGDYSMVHSWGWNLGGGASLGWGRTEVFVEARNIQFNTDIAPTARQIPIVLGINWY